MSHQVFSQRRRILEYLSASQNMTSIRFGTIFFSSLLNSSFLSSTQTGHARALLATNMRLGATLDFLDGPAGSRFTNLVAHPRHGFIKFVVELLISLKRFLHPHAHFLVHHVELFAAFLTLDSFAVSFLATEISELILDASRETTLTLLRQLIRFLILRHHGFRNKIHDSIVVFTR